MIKDRKTGGIYSIYDIIIEMKIGMFDSGRGGTTVLTAVQRLLPEEEYSYIADASNCPYGEKSDEELYRIVRGNVKKLLEWGAEIIVVACNTATTRCIARLREDYPEVSFVGTEPAVKLALESEFSKVLVLATPNTIKSERMKELVGGAQVELLACPGLAETIEKYYDTDIKKVREKLEELLTVDESYDAVVLGCTHYPLIREEIQKFYPKAVLLDGAEGVARRAKELVEKMEGVRNGVEK